METNIEIILVQKFDASKSKKEDGVTIASKNATLVTIKSVRRVFSPTELPF